MALRDWLPYIFPGIELFVSSEDIRKGKRWRAAISKELDSSNFGIACLTSDNLEAPWLLFESGALSKSVKEASLYTLLLGGLRPSDVEGPLSDFQHTTFEKEDFFKLVKSINEINTPKVEEIRVRVTYDKFWDDLNNTISSAIATVSKPAKSRSLEDMLSEVLDVTRQIARTLPESIEMPFVGYSKYAQPITNLTPQEQDDLWLKVVSTIASSPRRPNEGPHDRAVSLGRLAIGNGCLLKNLKGDYDYLIRFDKLSQSRAIDHNDLVQVELALNTLGYPNCIISIVLTPKQLREKL